MSMLFDTWKRLIKGIVLRFYREKIQKHVAVRVAETVKPLRFDYVLNGRIIDEAGWRCTKPRGSRCPRRHTTVTYRSG